MSEAFWALGRGTGLVALGCFTLAMVLGLLSRSGAPVPGLARLLGRFGLTDLHRTAALTGTALIGVHVGSLLLDPYAQLKLVDVVVPFLGAYRPLWLGLGTLAVDLLVVVTVVSLLRHRVGPRVFRLVHLAVWALWPVAVLHALGTGTDAGSLLMSGFVGLCVASVATALAWRVTPRAGQRGHARTPRRTPVRSGAPR